VYEPFSFSPWAQAFRAAPSNAVLKAWDSTLASVHRFLQDIVIVMRATLLAEELESLRQLIPGRRGKRIPAGHGDLLLRRGFAQREAGAMVITTMGHAKLAFEVTRASWFATPV